MSENRALTDKPWQRRSRDPSTWQTFVDEYLKDYSASGAYVRVYGGSLVTARNTGPRLIRNNGWIAQEIRKRSAGRITLADITPERVTLEIARIALVNLQSTVTTEITEDGLIQHDIPLALLPEDVARGITSVSFDVRGNRVLKTDKLSALQALAHIQGIDRPLTSVAGKVNAIGDGAQHEATGEDEIALMLQEFEDDPAVDADANDSEDVGDEIDGEYASDDR